MAETPKTMLAMRSLVTADDTLELALHEAPVPEPGPDQVLVRVEATPINPSDIALMFASPNLPPLQQTGDEARPGLRGALPAGASARLIARVGQALPLGLEGAGMVVKAGASPAAQALLGRTVSSIGAGHYAEYHLAEAEAVLALPDGASAADGAAALVNPLTALGMLETMRAEGHSALAHTAAASNLGRMLIKVCADAGAPLVNIVRRPEQAEELRALGAAHVVDSSAADFTEQLVAAMRETGATLGFDAVGGGPLTGQILQAMTAAQAERVGGFLPYGAPVRTQVYVYGRLDFRTIEVPPSLGMYWNVGGWLVFDFVKRVAPETRRRMLDRVASELTSTFASRYTAEISLAEALDLGKAEAYAKRATGEKFLIRPHL